MTTPTYPPKITDARWKQIESIIGISGTGVGQKLREAEKAYKTLGAAVTAMEAGRATPAAAKSAKDAASAALRRSATKVDSVRAKAWVKRRNKENLKTELMMTELSDFARALTNAASKLDEVDLEDHRGLKFVIDNYNHGTRYL